MVARLWGMVVKPRYQSWKSSALQGNTVGDALDCFHLIWVTRSASLVSKIMPEIHVLWDTLVDEWGRENTARVCRISIYVTDTGDEECEQLRQELTDLDLYQAGAIQFCRPDFCEIIQDHTLDMESSHTRSHSLLAFCGSNKLAQELHREKIDNDMLASITGNKQHQMEFVSESYGGYRKKTKKKKLSSTLDSGSGSGNDNNSSDDEDNDEQLLIPKRQTSIATVLATRRTVAYIPF